MVKPVSIPDGLFYVQEAISIKWWRHTFGTTSCIKKLFTKIFWEQPRLTWLIFHISLSIITDIINVLCRTASTPRAGIQKKTCKKNQDQANDFSTHPYQKYRIYLSKINFNPPSCHIKFPGPVLKRTNKKKWVLCWRIGYVLQNKNW